MDFHEYRFIKARPVWEQGSEKLINRSIALCTKIAYKGEKVVLALAAHCSFTVLLDGEIITHGPARAGHGYYRADELVLSDVMTEGEHEICIRVAGYNVNSFHYLDKPSFVCAELLVGGEVVAYTDAQCVGFTVRGVDERVRKVQRYSFQRHPVECYDLGTKCAPVALALTEEKAFICRDVPYGDIEILKPVGVLATGSVSYDQTKPIYGNREVTQIHDKFFGYPVDELEVGTHVMPSQMVFTAPAPYDIKPDYIPVCAETYVDVDMGVDYTGIFEFELDVCGKGELYVLFDEILLGGQLNCFRNGTSNIVLCRGENGTYSVRCQEPYTMRYIRLVAKGCSFTVKNLRLFKVAFPASKITAKFVGEDDAMRRIYDAAVETFRANTVDIYMDCPSRERAGWLCDSFFTSRVEKTLTGASVVEKAFLSNFLMPEKFEFIPEGMLPMCYPSDHNDHTYIPNWAMWYVVELGEYAKRSGDKELVEQAKDRMYALLNFFKPFENEFGLLEKLQSWVFIEWSKANELVQDVSFGSNMLYATMKDTIAALYGDEALAKEAAELRKTILDMSMTESGFFCDNAYRRDGGLVLSGERTEACQYYAFFCNIATPESHPWLWETLVKDFGPDRVQKGVYPEIWPANAFIGNYLRLDLLDRYGCHEALYENIKGYFLYMADKTGTLWELTADQASCNHGFASHVLYWMEHLDLVK